jgi:phage gpG-like protein
MKELESEVKKLDKNMPRLLGTEAVKDVKSNFDKQGYEGQKWRSRSAKTNEQYDRRGNYKGSVFNSSNPILKQTGNLYDSIEYKVTENQVEVGSFLSHIIPYAKRHNEGLKGMPQRKFIG